MADDPSVTAQANTSSETTSPEAANLNALIIDDFAAHVNLSAPAAGQTQEVLLAVGDIVRMDFDINSHTLVVDGNNLRVEFEKEAANRAPLFTSCMPQR